jgi:hypothetical protein
MDAYRVTDNWSAISGQDLLYQFSVSVLDQAITPRRPVQHNDDSAVNSLSLLMLNSAQRDSPLESTLPPFIPALRIDGQSLPQGKCITSASEG